MLRRSSLQSALHDVELSFQRVILFTIRASQREGDPVMSKNARLEPMPLFALLNLELARRYPKLRITTYRPDDNGDRDAWNVQVANGTPGERAEAALCAQLFAAGWFAHRDQTRA